MKMRSVFLPLYLFALISFISAQQGIITEVSGTVEIKKPSSQNWIKASAGTEVSASTVISTGLKSSAIIKLGNSSITVRQLTRLTLEEIVSSGNKETVKLGLQTGRVRASVSPPPGGSADFSVKTPSVTASVRGTEFDIEADGVSVTEGVVVVNGNNGIPVAVARGEATYVAARGEASAPVAIQITPPSTVTEAAASAPPSAVPATSAPPGAADEGGQPDTPDTPPETPPSDGGITPGVTWPNIPTTPITPSDGGIIPEITWDASSDTPQPSSEGFETELAW